MNMQLRKRNSRINCTIVRISSFYVLMAALIVVSFTYLRRQIYLSSYIDAHSKTNDSELKFDYEVGTNCMNLPEIRPSGVFFTDSTISMASSSEGIEPAFKIGSKYPPEKASSHMTIDIPSFQLMREFLEGRQDGLAIDIGANQGFYTYFLATMGFSTHAFEIEENNFHSLQHGTLFNPKDVVDRVYLYPIGINDKVKRFSLQGGNYEGFLKAGGMSSKLPVLGMSFDCFVYQSHLNLSNGVDFVKIDVEGFEIAVLKGAKKSLFQSKIGALIMEVGPNRWHRAQASLEEGIDELKEMASHFKSWFLLVRSAGSYWKTCPPALAEASLADKNPRIIGNVHLYKIETSDELGALLLELNKIGGDCNFWFNN